MWWVRTLPAASMLLAACAEEGYSVRVRVPGGKERAAAVEVSVIGRCDEIASMGADPPWGTARTVRASAETSQR